MHRYGRAPAKSTQQLWTEVASGETQLRTLAVGGEQSLVRRVSVVTVFVRNDQGQVRLSHFGTLIAWTQHAGDWSNPVSVSFVRGGAKPAWIAGSARG